MDDFKQVARRIFHATLASIDIPLVFERRVLRSGNLLMVDGCSWNLANFSDFKVIAIGKAAHAMLRGFTQALYGISFTGIAVAPAPPIDPVPGISYFAGGHPLPNE